MLTYRWHMIYMKCFSSDVRFFGFLNFVRVRFSSKPTASEMNLNVIREFALFFSASAGQMPAYCMFPTCCSRWAIFLNPLNPCGVRGVVAHEMFFWALQQLPTTTTLFDFQIQLCNKQFVHVCTEWSEALSSCRIMHWNTHPSYSFLATLAGAQIASQAPAKEMQGHHGTQSNKDSKTVAQLSNCKVESMAFELPSLPVIVAGGPGTWFANTLFVAPFPLTGAFSWERSIHPGFFRILDACAECHNVNVKFLKTYIFF